MREVVVVDNIMADLKARLLPPRPPGAAGPSEAIPKKVESMKRPLFQGMEGVSVKKRGHGVRSWIRIDPSGNTQILEVDKAALMRRCDLPARDLRLLDPLFVYPSTILGRERAIVVNLEQIRCIITADEVLLLNSLDTYVLQYVTELQRRLLLKNQSDIAGFKWRSPGGMLVGSSHPGEGKDFDASQLMSPNERKQTMNDGDMFSGSSADDLPFEFRALEVALEAACTYLDTQVQPNLLPKQFICLMVLSPIRIVQLCICPWVLTCAPRIVCLFVFEFSVVYCLRNQS